jgi:hypothetical protein
MAEGRRKFGLIIFLCFSHSKIHQNIEGIEKIDVIVKHENEENNDEMNEISEPPPKLDRQETFLNGQMEEEADSDMPSAELVEEFDEDDTNFDASNHFGMNVDEEEGLLNGQIMR